MKPQKRNGRGGRAALVVAACAVVLVAAAVACCAAYSKLRSVWIEQFVIDDAETQVSVNSGKMVKGDVIANEFGLRKGANISLIDFDAERRRILAKIPSIRSISVSRRLPRRVEISVVERTPVARLGISRSKRSDGRVVDTEGVVFTCRRGTETLPVLRERDAPGSAPGHRLGGRGLAALRLLEACAEPGFSELGALDADISRPDYILVTLGSYSRAKIAWEGMDEDTVASRKAMAAQLGNLMAAIRSQVGRSAAVWNATLPDRVFADTKEVLP